MKRLSIYLGLFFTMLSITAMADNQLSTSATDVTTPAHPPSAAQQKTADDNSQQRMKCGFASLATTKANNRSLPQNEKHTAKEPEHEKQAAKQTLK